MKICFRGKSKNKITYQPKRLFIEVKGKEQEYTLLGTNSGGYDHIADDFKAVFDGNLFNYNGKALTKEEIKKFITSLKNTKVSIVLNPIVDEDKDRSYGLVNTDIVTECVLQVSATLDSETLAWEVNFEPLIEGVDC